MANSGSSPHRAPVEPDSPQALTVLIIDSDMERGERFKAALQNSPYRVKHIAHSSISLLKEVEVTQPDIILMDIESPDRDTIDSLSIMSSINPKPVVMIAEHYNEEQMAMSVEAGVSAYISGKTAPDDAKYIIDVAVAQFAHHQEVRNQLVQAKQELQSRKWIDQAKAILIEQHQMTEQAAYSAIRKIAMDNGQKMEDVAKNIIAMHKLNSNKVGQ